MVKYHMPLNIPLKLVIIPQMIILHKKYKNLIVAILIYNYYIISI